MFKPNLKSLILCSALIISPLATSASFEDAQLAANEGRFEEALQTYNYMADRGYAPAMYELGKLYEGGFGVRRDYHKAAELYQKAVKKIHADSMFALGVLYQEGKGVKLDKEKAISLFEMAAQKKSPCSTVQFRCDVREWRRCITRLPYCHELVSKSSRK